MSKHEGHSKERGVGLNEGRPSRTEADSAPPKNHFIGVGISRYLHMPILPNARRDVEDVVAVLKSEYDFEDEHVLEFYDENALIDRLEKEGFEKLKEANPQDSLVVYFAGHGESGGWCMCDYSQAARSKGFYDVTDILKKIEAVPCKNILIIEDRCFPGNLAENLAKWPDLNSNDSEKTAYVLSSVRKGQSAPDGTPGENSPFVTILLEILRSNQNRWLLFTKELIDQKSGDSKASFINLFKGSEARAFVFYKSHKHPMILHEDEVWKKLLEMDEQPPQLLNAYHKLFPAALEQLSLLSKIKLGEAKAKVKWTELIASIADSFTRFIKAYRYYDSEISQSAYEVLFWIIDKHKDAKQKVEDADTLNILRKRNKLIAESKVYDYETVRLSIPLEQGAEESSLQSIEVGTKLVTIEWFQDFYLEFFFSDYKKSLKDRIYDEDDEIEDSHPATYLDWIEAIQFANWLSNKNNLKPYYLMIDTYLVGVDSEANGFRLPTEKEWEAIAEQGGNLPSNEDLVFYYDKIAYYRDNSDRKIQKIGLKKPDANGIYDIIGNVYEWCWDFHGNEGLKDYFVCKGGSFKTPIGGLSISDYKTFGEKEHEVGFRLIRSVG